MFQLFSTLNIVAKIIVLLILIIFVGAVVASFIIKSRYAAIHNDFTRGKNEGKFKFSLLNKILKNYKNAAEKNAGMINTQAIIEKEFSVSLKGNIIGERFVKNATSLMIILGLLGTFYGLTLSVQGLIGLLNNSDAISAANGMENLIGGLVHSIKGMGAAFITSLCGIFGSILLTILGVFISVKEIRGEIMLEVEEYLDNVVALEYVNYAENNSLELSVNKLFNGLSEQVETNYKNVLDKSISGLIEVVKMMDGNQQSFNKSLMCFQKTVDQFSDNTRDFTEFNYHLRNNVDRMNIALTDFTEKIESR
jgi:hypothetical protein